MRERSLRAIMAATAVGLLAGASAGAPTVEIVGYRPFPYGRHGQTWGPTEWRSYGSFALPWGAEIAVKGEGFTAYAGKTLEVRVYFGTPGPDGSPTIPVYATYAFDPFNSTVTDPENCDSWAIQNPVPPPPLFPPPMPYQVLNFNVLIGNAGKTYGKFNSDPPGDDTGVEADDPGVIWLRLNPYGGPNRTSPYYHMTARVIGGLPPSLPGDPYRAAEFYVGVWDTSTSPATEVAHSEPFYIAAPFDVRMETTGGPLLTIWDPANPNSNPLVLPATLPGRATRVSEIVVRNYTSTGLRVQMAVYAIAIPAEQSWRTEAVLPPGEGYVMWRTVPPGNVPNYHKDFPPIDFADFMVRDRDGDFSKAIWVGPRRPGNPNTGWNSFLLSVRVPRFLPPLAPPAGYYATTRGAGQQGGVAIFCDVRNRNGIFEPQNGEPYQLFDVLLPVPEFRSLKLLTPVLDLGAWPAGRALDSGSLSPPRGFVVENESNVDLANLKPLLRDIQTGLPLAMRSDEADYRSPYGHIVVPGNVAFSTADLLGAVEHGPPWSLAKPRVDAPIGTATDPIKVGLFVPAGTLIGTYYVPIFVFQDVDNDDTWDMGETISDEPCWMKLKVKEARASASEPEFPESMPAALWDESSGAMLVWFCRQEASSGGPRWRLYGAMWREQRTDGTWEQVQPMDISSLIPSGSNAPDPRYPDVAAYDCLSPMVAAAPDGTKFLAFEVAVWYRNADRLRPRPLYFVATASSANGYQPVLSQSVSVEPKAMPTLYVDPSVGGGNVRLWLVWHRGARNRESLMASFSDDYGRTWSAPMALWLGRGYSGAFGNWAGVQNCWVLRPYSRLDFSYVRDACAVEDYWRNPGDGGVYPCMLLVFSARSNYLGQEDLYIARIDPRVLGNTAYSPMSNSGLIPFPRRREVLKADPRFKVALSGGQVGYQVYRAKHPAWLAPPTGSLRPLVYVDGSLVTSGSYSLDKVRGRLLYKDPNTGKLVLAIDPAAGTVTFSQPLPANSVVEAEYAPTVYRITEDASPDFSAIAVNDKAAAKDPATGNLLPDWRLWVFWNKRDPVTGETSLYVQTIHYYRQDPANPNDDAWDLTWLREAPPKDLQPGPVPIHAAPGEGRPAVAVHLEPSSNPHQALGAWPGQLLRLLLIWPSVRSGRGDLYWCAYLPKLEPGI